MVLGHISDSDIGQLQTEDARLKWGKQFAESFLEEPLRVFFIFFSILIFIIQLSFASTG